MNWNSRSIDRSRLFPSLLTGLHHLSWVVAWVVTVSTVMYHLQTGSKDGKLNYGMLPQALRRPPFVPNASQYVAFPAPWSSVKYRDETLNSLFYDSVALQEFNSSPSLLSKCHRGSTEQPTFSSYNYQARTDLQSMYKGHHR
jgi:hypothetical protein